MENKISISFESTGLEEPKMYKEIIVKMLEKQLELLSEHARDIPHEIYRCRLNEEMCRTAKILTEILSIPFSF